jgi:hypothetical protein
MILRLLKGRGMVSGLFEKKRDAILPDPAPSEALVLINTEMESPEHARFSKRRINLGPRTVRVGFMMNKETRVYFPGFALVASAYCRHSAASRPPAQLSPHLRCIVRPRYTLLLPRAFTSGSELHGLNTDVKEV